MRISVNYFYEGTAFRLKGKRLVTSWIKHIISAENKKAGPICIIFCSDDYLLNVNKKFLKRNYFTDVISFDYTKENTVSGDIYISIDRVEENACKNKVSFSNELYRIISHGVLHLIGYTDKSTKERLGMKEKENIYLNTIYKKK